DIRIIDAFAQNSASPAAVWQTAGIAPPNAPQPAPAPGAVREVGVSIDIVTGAPVLKWRGPAGSNGGTISYVVKRRLPGDAPGVFAFIGIAGNSGPAARTFKDQTLPLGTDSVSYTITAQRGAVSGPTTQVSVQFGVTGGQNGAKFSVQGASPQPKMAA
ncbi:MAG: hypothetical protein K2Q09_05520, partial [Phycisphaerales bacterium]|nr:hypothetical protein [Phycisphaerales bacterium]